MPGADSIAPSSCRRSRPGLCHRGPVAYEQPVISAHTARPHDRPFADPRCASLGNGQPRRKRPNARGDYDQAVALDTNNAAYHYDRGRATPIGELDGHRRFDRGVRPIHAARPSTERACLFFRSRIDRHATTYRNQLSPQFAIATKSRNCDDDKGSRRAIADMTRRSHGNLPPPITIAARWRRKGTSTGRSRLRPAIRLIRLPRPYNTGQAWEPRAKSRPWRRSGVKLDPACRTPT